MIRDGTLPGLAVVITLTWSGAVQAREGRPTVDPCGPDTARIVGALADAATISAQGALAGEGPGYLERIQHAASIINDLADKQARRGCAEIAHALYMRVIDTFVGSAYAAQRQHAQVGLDDLRAAASANGGPQR